ncbi:Chemotaxis protein cheW [Candidatus Magnetomorum sp. HK-1]|nr:Chemotaxis protein cheW [Candidatus Magnetomorum sp. HK-1]
MNNDKKFCSFSIDDTLYGIDIKDVKEIKYDYMITSVRHAPPEIKGLVNVRGLIYIILNMKLLLNVDKKNSKNNILILLKPHVGEDPVGIEVDNHCGVVDVNNENIEYHMQEEIISSISERNEIINGLCKLQDKLMTILDSNKLLSSIKW